MRPRPYAGLHCILSSLRDWAWLMALRTYGIPNLGRTSLKPEVGPPGKPALQHISPKRVIVTPAVYPRLDEPLHFDIQSTGQKSHCVNISL